MSKHIEEGLAILGRRLQWPTDDQRPIFALATTFVRRMHCMSLPLFRATAMRCSPTTLASNAFKSFQSWF